MCVLKAINRGWHKLTAQEIPGGKYWFTWLGNTGIYLVGKNSQNWHFREIRSLSNVKFLNYINCRFISKDKLFLNILYTHIF